MHTIELNLRDVRQLFNSMDPSPFHDKDLDNDAEAYIVSWTNEYPLAEPVCLRIHLEQWSQDDPKLMLRDAVHNYFTYRADLSHREFRQLMKQGRTCLLIGCAFLGVCILVSELLLSSKSAPIRILSEGFRIGGWVAMWRPIEIYLYEWWPVRRREKVFRKLSRMDVQVVRGGSPETSS